MKLTKRKLRNLILEEFDLLLEAEPEEEEEEDTEAEDTEAEEGEPEEEEPEEEEPDVYVSPEEEASLSRSADDQILAYLIDFETNAIKSAQLSSDNKLRPAPDVSIEVEWYKRPLGAILFEAEGEENSDASTSTQSWVGSPDIDVAVYSGDVARLIDNYDSLLDVEALIINKASDYLLDKYDQETADFFIEMMDSKFDKTTDRRDRQVDDEEQYPAAPQAVGSMDSGGGA
jgi:hypothetical protein